MKRLLALMLVLIMVFSTFSVAFAKEDWNAVIEICRKGAKSLGLTCQLFDPDYRQKFQALSAAKGFPDEYIIISIDDALNGEGAFVIHTNGGTYGIRFSDQALCLTFAAGVAASLSDNNHDPYEYDLIVDLGADLRTMTLGSLYDIVYPVLQEYGMD